MINDLSKAMIDEWLDSDLITIENYFYLLKSNDDELIKAVDPSHGGKLVKKQITDESGRKQTKWVSQQQAQNLDNMDAMQASPHPYQKHATNASDEALSQAAAQDPNDHVRHFATQELGKRQQDNEDSEKFGKDYPSIKKIDDHAYDLTDIYKNELIIFGKGVKKDAQTFIEQLTGEKYDPVSLAKMCGGISDASSTIENFSATMETDADGMQVASVELFTDKSQITCKFTEYKTCINEKFLVKDTGERPSTGVKVFANQVKQLSTIGFHQIESYLDKSDDGNNGYYTFAKLGFQMSDDSDFDTWKENNPYTDQDNMFNGVEEDVKSPANSLPELLSTPQGQEEWKRSGEPFYGVFDLTYGSLSMLAFQNYLHDDSVKGASTEDDDMVEKSYNKHIYYDDILEKSVFESYVSNNTKTPIKQIIVESTNRNNFILGDRVEINLNNTVIKGFIKDMDMDITNMSMNYTVINSKGSLFNFTEKLIN